MFTSAYKGSCVSYRFPKVWTLLTIITRLSTFEHRLNIQQISSSVIYCVCCEQLVSNTDVSCCRYCLQCISLSPLSFWPDCHKQCRISDPCVLSRITRREWSSDVRGPVWGADRRIVSQPVPYPQTGRCPLSPRGRLLTRGEPGGCWNEETWELLRGWAGHLMSSTRAECDAEWAERERRSLCSLLQRPVW